MIGKLCLMEQLEGEGFAANDLVGLGTHLVPPANEASRAGKLAVLDHEGDLVGEVHMLATYGLLGNTEPSHMPDWQADNKQACVNRRPSKELLALAVNTHVTV